MNGLKEITELIDGDTSQGNIKNDLHLIEIINKKGLKESLISDLLKSDALSKLEVNELLISSRTLARRKKERYLSSEESDRLIRIARILIYAKKVFVDEKKAHEWLRRQNSVLQGEKPLNLLKTEQGARLVETILARIEHGIYS